MEHDARKRRKKKSESTNRRYAESNSFSNGGASRKRLPVRRPYLKYEKKKRKPAKHFVRDELLAYLEQERRNEEDREAFISSEYGIY